MSIFMTPGTFTVGCNYWASHAGAAMWSDWREDVVEADLVKLSDAGIRVLRVFPLWSDFQPISLLRGYLGSPVEYRIGEEPLSDDAEGKAGVSKAAVARFERFLKLAEEHGFKLIVGLLTGWMSGRLFAPPALEGCNLLTDPVAMMWEIRFVRYFVTRFKDSPAIAAWDLGNEFDCMADVAIREEAWVWVSSIAGAIKFIDPVRPVASGMHGLTTQGVWRIEDQAELLDLLTVHPYPLFTPYCDQEPVDTIRNGLHAVAEALFYRGIGGKPCFVEETGTLGPMVASDETAAGYTRVCLFSQWAHDCRGMLWWCANEQSLLTHAPYDWKAFESELGLFRLDGTPKPALAEMTKFSEFLSRFPFERLPERIVDGVCILSAGQDSWAVAFSSFILAKQAGLDIEFQYATQPIRDSSLYLLPSLKGTFCIGKRRMAELLEKVRNGATLYLSVDSALLSSFHDFTGVKVVSRERCARQITVRVGSDDGKASLDIAGEYRLNVCVDNAEVLGVFEDGNPAFTVCRYGKGKVYFLNSPLETVLAGRPQAFHGGCAQPYWMIYKHLKKGTASEKAVSTGHASIGITEHALSRDERIVVIINYTPELLASRLEIKPGWKINDCLYGSCPCNPADMAIELEKNDAMVLRIKKAD